MTLHPPDCEQKLGFDLLRRRMCGLARSVLGRERIDAIRPLAGRIEVEQSLARTAELQQALRVDDPLPALDVPDVREALRRAQPRDAVLDGEDLAAIQRVLADHRLATGYFRARRDAYPNVAALVLEIDPAEELERHIARVVDPRGHVREDASSELSRLQRAISEARSGLEASLLRALREAAREGFAAEEHPTIRNGRAVIPIRAEAKRKVRGFVHDVSGTGQTVYIEPAEVLDLNNEVRELELERDREVRRLLQELTRHVRSRLDQVRAVVDLLARLDELQARARLANELDALVPDVNDLGRVLIVRGRNPALALHFMGHDREEDAREENRPAPREVVPLDIELSDDVRTVIVTGPNAGGKSVALKTTGLLSLMVACGMPVPAAPGTSIPLFQSLFVDIGDEQSIEHDLSTFTSHLASLRRMLAEADDRSLVLIDEAGTGTDPAEGGALAEAVLATLTRQGARTVATTHYGTLKAFAHRTPHVANASMAFDQQTLAPTYAFRMGMPGSSYAFEIARRVGLPEDVIESARERAGTQTTSLEDLIASLEAREHELARRLRDTEDELRGAEKARRSFEERERSLRERTRQTVAEALAEAERVVAEANARVERTIREIREADAEREATRAAREQLEEFRGEVARARRELSPPEPPTEAQDAPGPIAVGDVVRIDAGGATGEVLEMGQGEAVVGLGQMRLRLAVDRIHRVGGPKEQQVRVRLPGDAGRGAPGMLEARRRIDLRGRRVDEALGEVERLIDQALAAGLPSVEILHGKGTGALREAVRAYLESRPEVSAFEDAAWNEGGHGVTLVSL